ncbi:MAG: CDGSH iron-sulfur domain-containing protein [Planctomycetota bacterium]
MSEHEPAAGGRSSHAVPGCATIRCRQDGPLVVELPEGIRLRVIDPLGAEFRLPDGKPAVALCRCGASGSKPFCDGSHRASGFRDASAAPRQG